MGILSGILGLFGCGNEDPSPPKSGDSFIANQIKIHNLTNELQKLRNGETEFNFIGITSNGTDCIYFVQDGPNFQIEFEAMLEQQIQYVEKLKEFSNSNGYKFLMISYGNKPKYNSSGDAPVIRIKTNSDLNKTSEIGSLIQESIFRNTKETIYDVVP